jgi:hypothetical protein
MQAQTLFSWGEAQESSSKCNGQWNDPKAFKDKQTRLKPCSFPILWIFAILPRARNNPTRAAAESIHWMPSLGISGALQRCWSRSSFSLKMKKLLYFRMVLSSGSYNCCVPVVDV